MLRVHCIRHVPFEGLGTIEQWIASRGHALATTDLFTGDPLPAVDSFDLLIVMGGPMSAYDDAAHPWLSTERGFIARAIEDGATVLGICLGAQLIAQVLGGEVTRNRHKEIGWWPTRMLAPDGASHAWRTWPAELLPFHWHGDTFSIPPGAIALATSEACASQAFEFDGGRVTGLQFHPELSLERIEELLARCHSDIVDAPYVQQPDLFLAEVGAADAVREHLFTYLDALVALHLPDAGVNRRAASTTGRPDA